MMSASRLADSQPARLDRGSLALGLASLLLALLLIWGLRQQAARQLLGLHAQAAEQLAHALVLARPAVADLPGFLAGWPGPAALVEVQLHDAGGLLLAQRRLPAQAQQAPADFGRLMQLPDTPAQLKLQINGQTWHLRAAASPAEVLDMQWRALAPALAAMLLMGALALGLAWQARRRWTQAVAQGLHSLQPVEAAGALAGPVDAIGPGVAQPATPSASVRSMATPEGRLLAPLLAGLQETLARQRRLMDAQGEQLEHLRTQAHCDGLTGLPNRRHFLATLEAVLGGEDAPLGSGLVLLRVRDLQGMNQRLGRSATDHVLQALGQTLQSYPSRVERCQVGRLNGADFALWLPAGGLATATADSLLQALRGPLCSIDPTASVSAGVVELAPPMRAGPALALADAALARAEADAGFTLSVSPADESADDGALPQGHAAWQRRIGRALLQGRVALGAFPVRTADGRQLHLDCPLRVALSADGPLEPASRWLSQAIRSRLCSAVDEKALALALAAISQDGLARCINIAAQSVADPEFIAAVTRRLETQPDAACRLWIDLPEALALERPALVRELSRRWRPLGVMLGLEHAGEALPRMPRLMDLSLDCVRIDSRFVNGLTGPEADGARRYLKGLVRLVQSVGLQACAEGVRSAEDLQVLWGLGFDAATGPALVPAQAPLPA